MMLPQQSPEPLAARDFAGAPPVFRARVDERVVQPSMVPLGVQVGEERRGDKRMVYRALPLLRLTGNRDGRGITMPNEQRAFRRQRTGRRVASAIGAAKSFD